MFICNADAGMQWINFWPTPLILLVYRLISGPPSLIVTAIPPPVTLPRHPLLNGWVLYIAVWLYFDKNHLIFFKWTLYISIYFISLYKFRLLITDIFKFFIRNFYDFTVSWFYCFHATSPTKMRTEGIDQDEIFEEKGPWARPRGVSTTPTGEEAEPNTRELEGNTGEQSPKIKRMREFEEVKLSDAEFQTAFLHE
jgi:hypothetical protein